MIWDETVTLRIRGRVQGVGFRDWAVREATQMEIDGWVRNRTDGSVEMVLCGSPTQIAGLTLLCYRGPALARVHEVESEPGPDDPVPGGFHAKPDT